MSTTTVRELVSAAMNAALAAVPDHHGQAGDPPLACMHFAGERVLFICIHHPGAGVHCASCAGAHLTRCGSLPEWCSICGSAPATETPELVAVDLGFPVRTTRGERAIWRGKWAPFGTAACSDCARAGDGDRP